MQAGAILFMCEEEGKKVLRGRDGDKEKKEKRFTGKDFFRQRRLEWDLNKEKEVLFFCLDTKEPKGQDCKINAKIISIFRWNK